MSLLEYTRTMPVNKAIPYIKALLSRKKTVVLRAPPGSGKTTIIPPLLLDEPWQKNKKILVLEPRRLAAKSAARRVAELLGEQTSETVGYITRSDRRVSSATRIEFLTEGVFTRRLLAKPELEDVGLVIFDEFHERHVESDLGLALACDIRSALNTDLKILVMSATLETEKFSRVFDDFEICECTGRIFPVEVKHVPGKHGQRLEEKISNAVLLSLSESPGSVLCFLPGMREIRKVANCLEERFAGRTDIRVLRLHGDLPVEEQEFAIRPPPPGLKKIVLASSIAETSITIEGITAVIDSGLSRKSVFDPRTGISRLETVRISKAAAEQRKGRAGRTAPGICIRLWSEHEHASLADFDRPEIFEADLSPLALSLADWGVADPSELKWIDPPPNSKFIEAKRILEKLGATDEKFRITKTGRRINCLGMHPRLGAMIVKSESLGLGELACEIAAIITEKDFLRNSHESNKSCDIRTRIETLRNGSNRDDSDSFLLQNTKKTAEQFKRKIGLGEKTVSKNEFAKLAGTILSFAFPDRIAKRRPGKEPIYLLACGKSGKIPNSDALSRAEFIVAAELDAADKDANIYLACPIEEKQILEFHADKIKKIEIVAWNEKSRVVEAKGRRVFEQIVLDEYPIKSPDPEKVAEALIEGIRIEGISKLPIGRECESLLARIKFVSRIEQKHEWSNFTLENLFRRIDEWLKPNIVGFRKFEELEKLDFYGIIKKLLGREMREILDKLAPKKIRVPSGSEITLDYASGDTPVLSARAQELFGSKEHPCVANGKVPVLVEILSPSMRPVQITSDLPGFWKNSYNLVRKDMKGRYPKHFWPEDPLMATPSRSTVKLK